MTRKDSGRAASPNRLSSSTEPASGLVPSGFDPARWRKRCSDCVRLVKNDRRYFCVMNCGGVPLEVKAYI